MLYIFWQASWAGVNFFDSLTVILVSNGAHLKSSSRNQAHDPLLLCRQFQPLQDEAKRYIGFSTSFHHDNDNIFLPEALEAPKIKPIVIRAVP
jgi:hypothetical protein